MMVEPINFQYWVTKKAVQRKFGQKEDENIIASDTELDTKIELFKSISETCNALYRIIDQYQERLCILAQEENAFGKFLKEVGKESPTTGKVMISAGKGVAYCGQQRMTVRVPLLRLYHEVDTFRGRAIKDTQNTLNLMEKERTEYRAALSWMKSVSTQLDPDTGKGLEKFRKAQKHVKTAKAKFDKYTLDCLEKTDLLAAARCNMFSHALVAYQNAMLHFANKSHETYKHTLKNLSKEPHYNFTILKELTQTNANEVVKNGNKESITKETLDKDQMLFFQDEFKDEDAEGKVKRSNEQEDDDDQILSDVTPLITNRDLLNEGPTNALIEINNINTLSSTLEKKDKKVKSSADMNISDLLGLSLDDEFSDFMSSSSSFMPSSLLISNNISSTNDSKNDSFFTDLLQNFPTSGSKKENCNKKLSSKPAKTGKEMTDWFQLFAELDPLANPDSIPSSLNVKNDSQAA